MVAHDRPARGIMVAVAMGIVFWLLIAVAVWMR